MNAWFEEAGETPDEKLKRLKFERIMKGFDPASVKGDFAVSAGYSKGRLVSLELVEPPEHIYERYLNDETLKQFDDEIVRVISNSIPELIEYDRRTGVATYYYNAHIMRYVDRLQDERQAYIIANYSGLMYG